MLASTAARTLKVAAVELAESPIGQQRAVAGVHATGARCRHRCRWRAGSLGRRPARCALQACPCHVRGNASTGPSAGCLASALPHRGISDLGSAWRAANCPSEYARRVPQTDQPAETDPISMFYIELSSTPGPVGAVSSGQRGASDARSEPHLNGAFSPVSSRLKNSIASRNG